MVRNLCQSSAKKRFHDHRLDSFAVKQALKVFCIGIASSGMGPVKPVELDLHEIPMVLVVQGYKAFESLLVSVERETEVADAACLALFQKEVDHTVVFRFYPL